MKAERILVQWGLVSENGRGPYIAGREDFGQTRTSTPLLELDAEAGTALTASGRRYRLHGQPDPDYALLVARSVWGDYFDLSGSVIESVTLAEAQAMIRWRRNKPITPAEQDEFSKLTGIRPDPDEPHAWGSGNVWEDLGIPDPEEGEDDGMAGYTVGAVPEAKASLILSIKDAMRQKRLSLTEAAWIAGIEPHKLRGILERSRQVQASVETLDSILEAIDEWHPMRNDF